MTRIRIKVKRLRADAELPRYACEGDAGMDLFSCYSVVIKAGERGVVLTGISIEFPDTYVALVWDKSGLALVKGIKTMAGVIESSYRGEYKVVLLNTSKEDWVISSGDKVAQVLFQPIVKADVQEVCELSETVRGADGFGSTGV